MVAKNEAELAGKRQSAAYNAKVDILRRSDPDLTDKQIDAIALDAVDQAVYGFDAKKDRRGKYIPQGIGAPGRETGNHFASILRYHGRQAYEDAVREIQRRDPNRHAALGLPKLEKAT